LFNSLLVVVHSVEAVQLWKPRPEAYRYLAQEVGVAPRRLAMVAGHPWDLHGAAKVGYATAWVNRDRRLFPEVFDTPDVEANTLGDVVERLVEYLG
jgi:2-haloacid dehalogenase